MRLDTFVYPKGSYRARTFRFVQQNTFSQAFETQMLEKSFIYLFQLLLLVHVVATKCNEIASLLNADKLANL